MCLLVAPCPSVCMSWPENYGAILDSVWYWVVLRRFIPLQLRLKSEKNKVKCTYMRVCPQLERNNVPGPSVFPTGFVWTSFFKHTLSWVCFPGDETEVSQGARIFTLCVLYLPCFERTAVLAFWTSGLLRTTHYSTMSASATGLPSRNIKEHCESVCWHATGP